MNAVSHGLLDPISALMETAMLSIFAVWHYKLAYKNDKMTNRNESTSCPFGHFIV